MAALPFSGRKLHFVGLGGAGMSGLATVAAQLGAQVSGSDRADSTYTARLREHGIEASIGHDAANLPPDAEVIISTAIPRDNPELAAARAAGARVLHRAELLGEVTRLKRSIAVSGTHGKTTTSAMIAHALRGTGADPAYVIGGELRSTGANAEWGEGEWIVVEADESDRSFLQLGRDVAIVTNVELDHHATYRSLSELEVAFDEFCAEAETTVAGPGVGLDADVRYGIAGVDARDGLVADAVELHADGVRFEVEGVPVELRARGEHNVLNALAALAACRLAGVPLADAAAALADFEGTGRRFEQRGTSAKGATVFDDYAHHPTEVAATLRGARTIGARRLVACFQPHLFSRTRELAREFGRALALADLVVIVDVYPARERAEDFPGVSGLLIAETTADAAAGRPVWWIPELEQAAQRLEAELDSHDVLVTLGAGDVERVAARLVGEGTG